MFCEDVVHSAVGLACLSLFLAFCLCVVSSASEYLDVLDNSRIHPETYDWARKMAVDALEYDDVSGSL